MGRKIVVKARQPRNQEQCGQRCELAFEHIVAIRKRLKPKVTPTSRQRDPMACVSLVSGESFGGGQTVCNSLVQFGICHDKRNIRRRSLYAGTPNLNAKPSTNSLKTPSFAV